jgi:hypothetical protein
MEAWRVVSTRSKLQCCGRWNGGAQSEKLTTHSTITIFGTGFFSERKSHQGFFEVGQPEHAYVADNTPDRRH